MFEKIKKVSALVEATHQSDTYERDIDCIRQAITQICDIGVIYFRSYDDYDNPILGRYKRFRGPDGGKDDIEVQYSSRLNYCENRHVICKEMCQVLVDEPSSRASTPEAVSTLIEHLILPSISREALFAFPPFASEKLAEIAAMELLCPLEHRKVFAKALANEEVSAYEVALMFRIPRSLVEVFFDIKYIRIVESLFDAQR